MRFYEVCLSEAQPGRYMSGLTMFKNINYLKDLKYG